MRRPVALAVALLAVVGFTLAPAALGGSSGSPEIEDDAGDVQVQSTTTPQSSPLQDWVDITGVWWKTNNETAIDVGVVVSALPAAPPQDPPQDVSLQFTATFTFHRPADADIAGWDTLLVEDYEVTMNAGAADASYTCDSGSVSFDRGGGQIMCTVASTEFLATDNYNGTFFQGDMIMNMSASSSGTYGTAQASDRAPDNGTTQNVYFLENVPEKPSGTDGGGGGGGGGIGGGGGGGNGTNTTGGPGDDTESTPGFETVAALAAVAAVALLVRRRD